MDSEVEQELKGYYVTPYILRATTKNEKTACYPIYSLQAEKYMEYPVRIINGEKT